MKTCLENKKNIKSFCKKRPFEHRFKTKWICRIIISTLIGSVFVWLCHGCVKDVYIGILKILCLHENNIIDGMKENASFLGTAIVTLSTILASLIVFLYSSMGYKNFGFSNRKIIAYTVGSAFFSVVLAANVFILTEMIVAFYLQIYGAFYLFCVGSCLVQGFFIVCVVISTTQYFCRNVIMKIERSQFDLLRPVFNGILYKKMSERELEYKNNQLIVHMDNILWSSETITERMEIMRDILLIPFEKELKSDIDGSEEDFRGTYDFFYQNFHSVASYMRSNPDDVQKVYNVFYEMIDRMITEVNDKEDSNYKVILHKRLLICISVLFLTLIPLNLNNVYSFFLFVANSVIPNEEETLKREVVVLCFLCFVILWIRKEVALEDPNIKENMEQLLKSIHLSGREKIENLKASFFFLIKIVEARSAGMRGVSLIWRIDDALNPEYGDDYIKYLYQILLQKGLAYD